jgi:hypothetical protein
MTLPILIQASDGQVDYRDRDIKARLLLLMSVPVGRYDASEGGKYKSRSLENYWLQIAAWYVFGLGVLDVSFSLTGSDSPPEELKKAMPRVLLPIADCSAATQQAVEIIREQSARWFAEAEPVLSKLSFFTLASKTP